MPPQKKSACFAAAYLLSGWAFLLPYVVAYAVYAATDAPVQHLPGEQSLHGFSLVEVFAVLHFLHFGLLLWVVWNRASHQRSSSQARADLFARPWWPALVIVALYWIPGPYLEFPSDPVEHVIRIQEWAGLRHISDHTSWRKMSYFLAYSIEWLLPTDQAEGALRLYYTGACALLTWQYYRLARTLGWPHGGGLAFCLLQFALYGNSAFSFHRYYGLSSTLIAQVAVLAFTRNIVAQVMAPKLRIAAAPLLAAAGLTAIIALNHIQGLLLVAVLALAAFGWRLSQSHPRWLISITSGALLASVLWLVLAQAVEFPQTLSSLQARGWINAWGGFNFWVPGSPAHIRVMEVLGVTGVVSVAIGFALMLRGQLIGWLVSVPLLLLILPVTALPLAYFLAGRDTDSLSIFNRQLLAIPIGLPFLWLWHAPGGRPQRWRSGLAVGTAGLVMFAACGGSRYSYNRLWHALVVIPSDLEKQLFLHHADAIAAASREINGTKIVAAPSLGYLLRSANAAEVHFSRRLYWQTPGASPASDLVDLHGFFTTMNGSRDVLLVVPLPRRFTYSPSSQAAQASGHWLPQENALNLAGYQEWNSTAHEAHYQSIDGTEELFRSPPLASPPPSTRETADSTQ